MVGSSKATYDVTHFFHFFFKILLFFLNSAVSEEQNVSTINNSTYCNILNYDSQFACNDYGYYLFCSRIKL